MIEVQTDGETVWFTQAQLTELFGTSKQNIFQEIALRQKQYAYYCYLLLNFLQFSSPGGVAGEA